MAKKITALLLAICLLFCLSACNDNNANSDTLTNVSHNSTSAPTNNSNTSQETNNSNNSVPNDPTENNPVHVHSYSQATCTTPATCSCGTTKGIALGHDYADATCTTPKTCKNCKATTGSALGHNYADATCTAPKTCKPCNATTGSALGHNYADATCTTPKTCKTCKITEGSALGHNYADATCTAPKTCKTCKATTGSALGHDFKMQSATNGYKVGSTITDACSRCSTTKKTTIQPITISAYCSSMTSINGWYNSVGYSVSSSGGYGKHQYKYEIFSSETSYSPSLTEDFSSETFIGWSSRFYCNGNVLQITVKDEAGNTATKRIVVG